MRNTDQIVLARREELTKAKAITTLARSENRGLTSEEEVQVKAHIAESDRLKAEHDAIEAENGIRSSLGQADAFKSLAHQIVTDGRGEVRYKDVTQSGDIDLISTRVEPGITALPADERYIAPVFTNLDPGTALHVTDFRVISHGIGSGEVERDPLAIDGKASLDVSIEGFTEDLRLLAVLVEDVPNLLLSSEAQLASVLESEMKLAIRQALDLHVVNAIGDASVPHGGIGSSVQALVRSGINEMALNGFRPDVVAISPGDAATVDELTALNAIPAWPFGCRIVVSPDVDNLAPMLIDTKQAGVLYQGALSVQSDPYTGFKNNTTNLRVEGTALLVVRRANAILVADGSGS